MPANGSHALSGPDLSTLPAVAAEVATSAITEAARLLLGNPEAVFSIRAAHRRKDNGDCAGHFVRVVHWPCDMILIANELDHMLAPRRH